MDQATGLRSMVNRNGSEYMKTSLTENVTGKQIEGHKNIRVISVTSGKGGVGKTTVVANLARALFKLNKKVLILDADIGLANMDIMLGLNPRYTIGHLLRGEKKINDIIIETTCGFDLLPAASGIQELTDLDNSQRLLLLNELDSLQDRFDVLLIDTGAGISSNVMYFNFAAMEKVVVITNEPTSLTDAYALIKILTKKYNQKKFKILINNVRNATEADKIYRHLSLVVDQYLGSPSLDYLGWIPHDKLIPKTIRQQKVLLKEYPNTVTSKSFKKFAKNLLASYQGPDLEGDIRFFWRKLLDE